MHLMDVELSQPDGFTQEQTLNSPSVSLMASGRVV